MTPEFKAKWIEALRSGEYKQAKECLRDMDGAMCCLGVAANLIDPCKWNPAADEAEDIEKGEVSTVGFGWDGDQTAYTGAVSEAIGILSEVATSLAQRNDGTAGFEPHTFAEIADYIEKNL